MKRQSYVRNVVKSEKVDIMLLQETKTGDLPLSIKNYECITGKTTRGAAGCMLLVHQNLRAQDMYKSECGRVIACKVKIQEEYVGIVNVYAPNEASERKLTWEVLEGIDWDVPMIFAGDWNLNAEETNSIEWLNWTKKYDARDASELKGCEDLINPTWTNRHTVSGFIAKRLDRFFLSEQAAWINHEVQGTILYRHSVSDHSPIKLCFKCKVKRTVDKGPPPL